jgi:phosphoribosyl 1,2-cyclic phosphodiesterase
MSHASMSHSFRLAVELWGARGSVPTPGIGTQRYGGNTTCISVRSAAGDRVIIDAGTGIRKLGRALQAETPRTEEINLFLTHFHWDHIQGLPFFLPLLQGPGRVRFHSGVSPLEARARLERQMSDPFFTLDFTAVKAECEFLQMGIGVATQCGALAVHSFPLNHPQGAWGYRIECEGAVVVVATDVEHGHPTLDKVLRECAANADLLIYDAQYTDAEYAARIGWGHSTAAAAASVSIDAGVKQLLLCHHDPEHDDEKVDEIAAQARILFPATSGAQEGMIISL